MTAGESSASPAATVRIAAISCSGGSSLSTKPLAPARERLVDVLVEVERREDQDPRGGVGGEDAPGRLEPVELGHADVHQDDGRVEARRLLDRLEAVARLGHDLDVLLVGEQHPEAGADHRLVVGDEHADRHAPVAAEREARAEDEAAAVAAPGGHLAAVDLDALADADEPVAEAVARRRCRRRRRAPRAAARRARSGRSRRRWLARACLSALVRPSWTIR